MSGTDPANEGDAFQQEEQPSGQPSDDHHDWITGVLGIDPRQYSAPEAAAGGFEQAAQGAVTGAGALNASPLPSPGIIEGIEEAVESGVRVIAEAAPEILETAETVVEVAAVATVAPAVLVAAGVGAAVFLWSNDAGAVWDGQTNPETGRPFTSQEEWDRYQASKRKRGPANAPAPIVEPPKDPWEDDDPDSKEPEPAKPKTCDDLRIELGIEPCPGNTWESERDFLADARFKDIAKNIARKSQQRGANGLGEHITYYDRGGNELGSLRVIQCCHADPDGAGAVLRYVFNP